MLHGRSRGSFVVNRVPQNLKENSCRLHFELRSIEQEEESSLIHVLLPLGVHFPRGAVLLGVLVRCTGIQRPTSKQEEKLAQKSRVAFFAICAAATPVARKMNELRRRRK
jgi:hypothetical protein